jgi:hypothetical protein
MGIFGKLFGSRKLKTTDSDFGEIEVLAPKEMMLVGKLIKYFWILILKF